MTNCPHCKKRCNPIRLIWITKRTPYKCPNCKGSSQFSTFSAAALGAVLGTPSYHLYQYMSSTFNNAWYLNAIILVLLMLMIAILVQWLFFKLEAV